MIDIDASWTVEDGRLAMVRDADAVAQRIKSRLSLNKGEWFLDRSAGVDYIGRSQLKPFDPTLLSAEIVAQIAIAGGPGTKTQLSNFVFDPNARHGEFSYRTDIPNVGAIEDTVTV